MTKGDEASAATGEARPDEERTPGGGRRLRSAAAGTFEALGYRDFRYFWAGAWLSNAGTWMQSVAQGWVVAQITGSSFWVGMVAFAGGLPSLFLALPAGVMADRLDRRRLLLVGQTLMMLLAFWLAYLIQGRPLLAGDWNLIAWITAVAFLTGMAMALTIPAWQAIIPDLVPRETLLNAVSLNSAQFHAARLVGPAIAGALMARLGIASAFWANAVSFLAVIWALIVIRPEGSASPDLAQTGTETARERLLGGLTYARTNVSVGVLLLSVAIGTFFGLPYLTLLPLLVKGPLGGGSAAYAYLMAANGLGAVGGALAVAALAKAAHRPTLIRAGLLVFSISAIVIALSRSLWLTACLMPLAGAAFLTMQSAINTGIQIATPRGLRGRVMALFVLAFMGIMPLGSLAFGALGHAIGVPWAVAVGAAVCLVWGIALSLNPRLLAAAA